MTTTRTKTRKPTATNKTAATRLIPLSQITPGKNAREQFPDEEIADLAESIRQVGLIAPILVRPIKRGKKFEIVCGERRYRASVAARTETILCIVRELSDKQAAAIATIENWDRQDLSAGETSSAFQTLLDTGYTAKSIAELVRIPVDAVERKLALLELPAFWQAWLREDPKDHRRGVAAEVLLELADLPQILDAMQCVIDNKRWPIRLTEWRREYSESILRLSRDADPRSPVGPIFKMTPDLERRLDVRPIRIGKKAKPRAFNVSLFDELQDRANEPAPAEPRMNGRQAENGKPKPVTPATSPARRLNQPADSNEIEPVDDGPDAGDFQSRLARYFDALLRRWIGERITKIDDLLELESVAVDSLGIDIRAEWRCTREFLELHNGEQLRELAAGWGIDLVDCRDRGECIAVILHHRPAEIPAALLECTSAAST